MYNKYSSDKSWGAVIVWGIVLIILFLAFRWSETSHIASAREDANMVFIQEGYCYDVDTSIIYIETMIQKYNMHDTPIYRPYINERGNYCKYVNGAWVELAQ